MASMTEIHSPLIHTTPWGWDRVGNHSKLSNQIETSIAAVQRNNNGRKNGGEELEKKEGIKKCQKKNISIDLMKI